MARVLVVFAHPVLEKSRLHRRLLDSFPHQPDLTFHDLYEHYPAFDIDVAYEQALLNEHDVIVWQHPLYWYSVPPLLKQWIDLVLTHGWAYGSQGNALVGKQTLSVISTGGPEASYTFDGFHGHTIHEFLLPLEQTARLCKMRYLPPFLVHGTHRLSDEEIEQASANYRVLLDSLCADRIDDELLGTHATMNEVLSALTAKVAV